MNPEVFKIIDGKLYLSWSKKSIEEFSDKDKATENIKAADENWENLKRHSQ